MTKSNPSSKTDSSLSQTLLDKMGGVAAVDSLVGALYFNMLNDARVAHFFESVDVEAIWSHQRKFLATALGGMDEYQGRDLADAHRRLVEEQGLDQTHFDAVIDILAFTLKHLGHSNQLTTQIVDRVAALRTQVLPD